jgi:excisionase family DNA binding protein
LTPGLQADLGLELFSGSSALPSAIITATRTALVPVQQKAVHIWLIASKAHDLRDDWFTPIKSLRLQATLSDLRSRRRRFIASPKVLEIAKRSFTAMAAMARVLTVGDLSEYLRVHRSTVYRLLKKGQLPGFKIGSDWRFNVEAIDQWRMRQSGEYMGESRIE